MVFRLLLFSAFVSILTSFSTCAPDNLNADTPTNETEGVSRDFTYNGINYTVIDGDAKTCRTKCGDHEYYVEYGNHQDNEVYTFTNANDVQGNLTIPEYASDGRNEYKVVEIGDYSFARCRNLTNVVLPNGIETIGTGAFIECDELESIDLPFGLKTIKSIAFYKCLSLREAELPEGLLEIGGSDLSDMVNISNGAFYQCVFLRSVKLPKSLRYVGDGSFSRCRSLSNIEFPYSMSDEIFGSGVFSGCSVESFVCPDGFKCIPPYFMYECERLSSVTLSESIATIGNYAFYRCPIKSIKLPSSLSHVGDGAFCGCQSLSVIEIPGNLSDKVFGDNVFSGCKLESFEIPKGFEAIPDGFFKGWVNLSVMDIPKTVTYIGNGAFSGCTNLQRIGLHDNITGFGEYAFYKCASLDDITLPEGITEIPEYAFSYIPIKTIKLPDSVRYIRKSAFIHCVNLERVELSEALEKIENGGFFGCTALESMYFPDSLKTIEDQAFGFCSNLKMISLPAYLQSLEPYSFMFCSCPIEVEYRTDDPREVWSAEWAYDQWYNDFPRNETPFDPKTFEQGCLKVGIGAKEKASNTLPWKFFVNIEETDFSGVQTGGEDKMHSNKKVYDMNGCLVDDSTERLPSGLYIVREGGKASKVMVP